jgi:hypothetical protein
MMKRRALKLARDAEVPETSCANCGKRLDRASGVVDKHARNFKRPQAGDLSLCIGCGHVSVFDENLRLREPTDAEIVRWAADDRLVKASYALASIKGKKP